MSSPHTTSPTVHAWASFWAYWAGCWGGYLNPCALRGTCTKLSIPAFLGPIAFLVNVYTLTPAAFYCSTRSLVLPLPLLLQNNRAGKNQSRLSISITLAQPKEENPRLRGKAFPFVILLHVSLLRFPNAWGHPYILGTGSPLLPLQEFTI